MNPILLSRRAFATGVLVSAGAAYAAKSATPTPATIVERIQRTCAERGVEWQKETVDTFKIGPVDTPVTGVISTFMATIAVMRKAVALGASFIVSHEPIFYNHLDDTNALQADPVYQAKVRFATQHGLTVWRFHDHWHKIKPEPMSSASIEELGWARYLDNGSEGFRRTFTRPETTLRAVAEEIANRYPSASVRVIGRPDLPVRRIVNIGHGVNDVVKAFAIGDIAIAPEVREWDSAELTRDVVMHHANKGLILIAHERGEEGGMKLCSEWLTRLVPEVAVVYINSGEPFTALSA